MEEVAPRIVHEIDTVAKAIGIEPAEPAIFATQSAKGLTAIPLTVEQD